jgi:hypothetical protein
VSVLFLMSGQNLALMGTPGLPGVRNKLWRDTEGEKKSSPIRD